MPYLKIRDYNYYYEEHGVGSEVLVFSHGLIWSSKMFQKQIAFFSKNFRIICYDHRGQGQSESANYGYDMDAQYEDAAEIIEQLNLGKVHFLGLSMGGFIGMRLAARRPDLIKSLILLETSALPEPFVFKYNMLNLIVKIFGISAVKKPVMKIMFGTDFLNDKDRESEKIYWETELMSNKKNIVKAVQGVIDRKGIDQELSNIKCSTLVLVGDQDVATVPAKAEFINAQIRNSKLVYIKGAGHSSCIEEPEQVNKAIHAFLNRIVI